MSGLVIDGCSVVTMDTERTEYAVGHVVVDGARITSVGAGRAPRGLADTAYVDGTGCLATPGLVNTHHHLYQWLTRGVAVDQTLFEWLTALYPVWAGLDEDAVRVGAIGALVQLARTGCTTTMDHHYVFPADGGDLLAAEIEGARTVGLRFLPTRGSMDLGRSKGGLPPDHVVEEIDAILAATTDAVDRFHDPSPDSMLRVGVAPCSPFSVTGELLAQAAALARDKGVRLHTHLAETADEDEFCRERFGCRPVEYVRSLGWLGPDVWLAHGVHFDDADIAALAASGTSIGHCPSSNARLGSGICRSHDLRAAGVTVGLGVDGAASNEAASLVEEVRHSVLFARAKGGPQALTVRDGLEMATIGGARALGWDDRIGSLEPGKLADIALWRVDTAAHAGIDDPVAALVLGAPPPLELLVVQGRELVRHDTMVTVDEERLGAEVREESRRLAGKAAA